MGKSGTLIVPTFTYSFCNGEVYDVFNSPSTLNYFTEVARTAQGFTRSEDPIFSVTSKGPATKKMISNLSIYCLGKGSVWERMHIADAHNLMLGTPFDSTFLHYVEEHYRVPYRYDKIFTGTVKKNDRQYRASYTYYVRYLELDPQSSLDPLYRKCLQSGILQQNRLGAGHIMTARSKDLFDVTGEMLSKDPYALVTVPKRAR